MGWIDQKNSIARSRRVFAHIIIIGCTKFESSDTSALVARGMKFVQKLPMRICDLVEPHLVITHNLIN